MDGIGYSFCKTNEADLQVKSPKKYWLMTLWSCPNYCYRCGNHAKIMKVNNDSTEEFVDIPYSATNLKDIKSVFPYFL